ncbi:hypothetical protein GGE43_003892 [Agrobacterium tumefaciens]|jgi:hypothetical protein|uniref:Uncharacterized protein n=1 Tax=Agrobacterium radiobacter TaxID=362 RepID=A0ABR6JC45_AGRRD|nr:hypothetical protein [Agrobacterium radiobacter]MBB4337320.1 hypothetical protein [Agrobacterium radiobacter]MBB4492431.1 hypothetical protein [Agrobacterium radiobacter]MBB4497330.1 hypothetical protein [Agrobacterium radiobacter]MBB4502760.1 hypothetical protein [Agrobacterium radiobacter]
MVQQRILPPAEPLSDDPASIHRKTAMRPLPSQRMRATGTLYGVAPRGRSIGAIPVSTSTPTPAYSEAPIRPGIEANRYKNQGYKPLSYGAAS